MESLDKRYALAKHLLEREEYEEAIELCLEVVKIERNWNNAAAQKLLLEVITKLGAGHELSIMARKKLQKVLF